MYLEERLQLPTTVARFLLKQHLLLLVYIIISRKKTKQKRGLLKFVYEAHPIICSNKL